MSDIFFIYQRMLPYHYDRYKYVANVLNEKGYNVYALEVSNYDSSYGKYSKIENNKDDKNKKESKNIITLYKNENYLSLKPEEVCSNVYMILKKYKPSIIFAPAPAFSEGAGAIRYKILENKKKPVKIILMDDAWDETVNDGWIKKNIKMVLYNEYDGAFLPGKLHGKYFNGISIPYNRQRYPVDVIVSKKLYHNKNNTEYYYKKEYFLSVGRLVKRKNFDLLIKAFKMLNDQTRNENCKLVIIGDGPEKNGLKKLAKRISINENILWLGQLDNEQARGWMRNAKALIVPSKYEQWALVVNEAWSEGTPVIGSNTVGALRSTLPSEYEYLMIKPNSVYELKRIMEKIISMQERDYQKLKEKCWVWSEKYSINKHVDAIIELINIKPRSKSIWFNKILIMLWKGRVVVW